MIDIMCSTVKIRFTTSSLQSSDLNILTALFQRRKHWEPVLAHILIQMQGMIPPSRLVRVCRKVSPKTAVVQCLTKCSIGGLGPDRGGDGRLI